MAKTKITRISAKDPNKPQTDKTEKKAKKSKATPVKTEVAETKKEAPAKKAEKKAEVKTEKVKSKKDKKPFVLFRPFIALGHYLRDSWREIRQVRWPNRKTTWKMVLAVFVYTAIFVVIIMLLDALLTLLFNFILK